MLENNVAILMSQIRDNDLVLDIGGWFRPFNRANWVIDAMPYETRGKGGADAGTKEYFSKQTWLQKDICDRKPLPFMDKEIDFVICSHTLEDIRDPVFLCSEICRVGKRGYIETPSKFTELSFGIESRHFAGYSHHRWIIEIEKNKIAFLFKPHFIYSSWQYHFPSSYARKLKQEERVQWLFWEGSFEFEEKIIIEYDAFTDEIAQFIKLQHAYPDYRYRIDRLRRLLKKTIAKFSK